MSVNLIRIVGEGKGGEVHNCTLHGRIFSHEENVDGEVLQLLSLRGEVGALGAADNAAVIGHGTKSCSPQRVRR